MPYSQSTITRVNQPFLRSGQVFLSWDSSALGGTWFQVYINQQLSWYGQRCSVWVPLPAGPCRIDIGTVDAGEQMTSFSSLIGGAPARRCQLQWFGGSFLGSDIAGFHVYGSALAGAAVDFTSTLADIAAYPAGIETDGMGLGQFGTGGFGCVAGAYTWLSGPLGDGNWAFAVRPYDEWGNEGSPELISVGVTAPPRVAAAFEDGTRLRYCLEGFGESAFGGAGYGTANARLTWNPCLI